MNDADRWIYFDGPEPEHLQPLLDALRDLPPATPEGRERAVRRFLERLRQHGKTRRKRASRDSAGRAATAQGEPRQKRATRDEKGQPVTKKGEPERQGARL